MTTNVFDIATPDATTAPSGKRKIGVAHLLHTVAYGGPETIIINWLSAQDRTQFDVHLICFADAKGTERPFVEAAEAVGLQIHFIPWNRSKPIFKCARLLSTYLREHHIDILHCYNTYAECVGVVAKRMTGVRLVTTKWMWGKLDWKRAILQRIERMILPLFDRVTAQSEFAARLTVQPGSSTKRPVDVLISGLEQPLEDYSSHDRDRARLAWGATPDDIVFLNLARFWPEKAHDVLIRSFRLVVDQDESAKLWLAGVGPTLEPSRQLVQELKLEGNVAFLGFCTDLSKLLPLVDIQIHSSNMEGIPLALCSGLSAGLPIVATAVGGVPEIIEQDVSGLLVPPDHPELLAQSALRLLRGAELRARLGAAAQQFMQDHYSLKAAVHRLETVYLEMIAA